MPGKYRRDFEDIQNKLVQLYFEITEILEKEESVSIERLKGYVSKFPEMIDSLDNANTISDIIDIIYKHSSLTSCSHLKGVAELFNVSAAVEKIEEYYKLVDDFCQNKLATHIYMKPFLNAKSTEFTPSTTITFKLRWQPNDKTLSDILELLKQAFDEQNVYVHIVVVREGSVRVICCAPQYLMTELVRLAQKNRELLVESSVTYLRVGDTIVVDTSDQNEVRICYQRNCVTIGFYHQISLAEDLVFLLTVALQLKGKQFLRFIQVTHGQLQYVSSHAVTSDHHYIHTARFFGRCHLYMVLLLVYFVFILYMFLCCSFASVMTI